VDGHGILGRRGIDQIVGKDDGRGEQKMGREESIICII